MKHRLSASRLRFENEIAMHLQQQRQRSPAGTYPVINFGFDTRLTNVNQVKT